MDIPVTSTLRGALGALAALAFTSTVWLAATPAAADDYDTCGKASGNEAIAACTRAIDSGQYSGRQLAALFNNRCSEWNGKQESDKAFADCDEAIRLYPNYALAFFNRGNAYYAKGQYDRAIEDYNQSIQLNPSYANAFSNRGNTYATKGQYDRAIEDYNEAIRLNPKHAAAFYNRGTAYNAKGQSDHAIEDFNQTILLDPDQADAFYNRGIAYKAKGQYDRAIEDYSEARTAFVLSARRLVATEMDRTRRLSRAAPLLGCFGPVFSFRFDESTNRLSFFRYLRRQFLILRQQVKRQGI